MSRLLESEVVSETSNLEDKHPEKIISDDSKLLSQKFLLAYQNDFRTFERGQKVRTPAVDCSCARCFTKSILARKFLIKKF